MEIVWKLIEAVIDSRIKAAVVFHDISHGFRAKRGTGTAILEVKLAQGLASVAQVPFFFVFLDLWKTHDALDRDAVITTMEECGVGPNARALPQAFFDSQAVALHQEGFHGSPFKATRGCVQGSLLSPEFNVMIDKVL